MDETSRIVAWLRSFDGQHERAIAAGDCIRGSTAHGELRDEANWCAEIADRIEAGAHLKDTTHAG